MSGVVAGIGDRDDAYDVLHFAMREAAARAMPLTVLHVSEDGGPYDSRLLSEQVAAVEADWTTDDEVAVPTVVVIASGDPVAELLRAARGAQLLVLGVEHDRCASEIRRSVAAECIQRSTCPVAVVRTAASEPGRTRR